MDQGGYPILPPEFLGDPQMVFRTPGTHRWPQKRPGPTDAPIQPPEFLEDPQMVFRTPGTHRWPKNARDPPMTHPRAGTHRCRAGTPGCPSTGQIWSIFAALVAGGTSSYIYLMSRSDRMRLSKLIENGWPKSDSHAARNHLVSSTDGHHIDGSSSGAHI